MTLKTIRLELARTKEFPDGNRQCGYEFTAPLDASGHIDAAQYAAHKAQCKVKRFWVGQDDERGELIRTRGHRWVFSYAPGEEDDEPIFKFDRHSFVVGEYVSITEHDGVTRPFRIASVR